jgi:probable rRNA maturation factor
MKMLIENLQSNILVNDNINDLISRAVELSLKSENFNIPCEVSILLVDDENIREINREHRNIDKSTDVLSFPMIEMYEGTMVSNEGDFDLDENLLLLGDIVISMEMVKKQAEEFRHSFERELCFLVTHGVFHLLGFDHEHPEEEKIMIGKQEAVLRQMKLFREKAGLDEE